MFKVKLDENTTITLGNNFEDTLSTLEKYSEVKGYTLRVCQDEEYNEIRRIKLYDSLGAIWDDAYVQMVEVIGSTVCFITCTENCTIVIDDKEYKADELVKKYKSNTRKLAMCDELNKEVDCATIKAECDRARNRGCNESCSRFLTFELKIRLPSEDACDALIRVDEQLDKKYEYISAELDV